MPLRRVVRGRPTRINVEPQEKVVPNAPKVQPLGKVTNVKFCEAIQILTQVATNRVRQQLGA